MKKYKILLLLVMITQVEFNASEMNVISEPATNNQTLEINSISGSVRDASEFIPGAHDATVTINNAPTNNSAIASTLGVDVNSVDDIDRGSYNVSNVVVGEYPITFTKAGYLDTTVTLTVTEEINTIAPTISGADNVSIDFGSDFSAMDGVTATGQNDEDYTNLITVTGEVNENVSGNYTLTYSVIDPTNSDLVTNVDRVVTVKPDPSADTKGPAFTGIEDKALQWGAAFDPRAGVSAYDEVAGDVDFTVTGSVNTKVTGTYNDGFKNKVYTLTYTATDGKNITTETRDITVKYYADHKNDKGEAYRNYYNGGKLKQRNYYYNNDYSATTSQRIYYNSNETVIQRNYYYSNGKLKQKNYYGSNGVIQKAYYYNTAGTKTAYKTYHSNGKLKLYYNYYSNGKVSKRQEYSASGKRVRITEYNSYGYYKMIETYNSQGYKTSHKDYVFGSQSKESSRQKIKDYTYYTNNNRIHTRTTWNSSGKKTTYYERYNSSSGQYKRYYNYFSNGKISKKQIWASDGDLTDTHEYYSNGKVSKNYDYYDNGTISKRYTYNNKGTKTSYYTRYKGTKSGGSHKSGSYKDYRNYYSNGKWSNRKLFASDGDITDYKEYYSNGEIKNNYDYYSNGTISKRYTYNSKGHRTTYYIRYQGTKNSSGHHSGRYKEYRNYDGHGHWTKFQTWSSNGHRTDYKEYYSNHNKSKDYNYYSNGKVSTRTLYYSNGKYKEIKNYYSDGSTKRIRKYNSSGHKTSDKSYSQKGSGNSGGSSSSSTLEKDIFNEINRVRKARGLSTLSHNSTLDGYCTREVNNFKSTGVPHSGAIRDDAMYYDNNNQGNFNYYASNAYGPGNQSAATIVQKWTDSSGHAKLQFKDNVKYLSVQENSGYVEACYAY